jgi:hypothetical protein
MQLPFRDDSAHQLRHEKLLYATTYANETGPYPNKLAALKDALMASYWLQAQELPTQGEYGSMIYVDRYGQWWFTDPVRGVQLPDGSWYTSLHTWNVVRPDSTVDLVEHSHPKGVYDPTGTANAGPGNDNESD